MIEEIDSGVVTPEEAFEGIAPQAFNNTMGKYFQILRLIDVLRSLLRRRLIIRSFNNSVLGFDF
jgi:hypothetical protein